MRRYSDDWTLTKLKPNYSVQCSVVYLKVRVYTVFCLCEFEWRLDWAEWVCVWWVKASEQQTGMGFIGWYRDVLLPVACSSHNSSTVHQHLMYEIWMPKFLSISEWIAYEMSTTGWYLNHEMSIVTKVLKSIIY